MNPRIPADDREIGRWLVRFVTSHAKRESPLVEVEVGPAEPGRSLAIALVLGRGGAARRSVPAMALDVAEVAEGRTRFAWCQALAERVREDARRLVADAAPDSPTRP